MNLLRSMCCFFSRCAEEEPKPTTEKAQAEAPGDLGQRDAEREKVEKDRLANMEGPATYGQGPQGLNVIDVHSPMQSERRPVLRLDPFGICLGCGNAAR
jgi:hypothetical protein